MPVPLQDLEPETLRVEIEGVSEVTFTETNFISYRLSSDFTTPTDEWDFVVYSEDNPAKLRRTWRPWQPVRLYIGGALQCLGRIDRIEGTGKSGTALRVSGRDYLADIVDPGVDPRIQFKTGATLGDALLQLFKPWEISGFEDAGNFATRSLLSGRQVGRKKNKIDSFQGLRLYDTKAQENQGVFEFANRLCSRHSCVIRPGTSRNKIALTQPDYDQDPSFSLVRPGNLLPESHASRDYGDVPTVTLARGRSNDVVTQAIGGRHELPTFVSQASKLAELPEVKRILINNDNSEATRQEIFDYDARHHDVTSLGGLMRIYKPMFYRDRDSKSQAQLEAGVRRMLAERLRKTLTYTAVVRGHHNPKTGQVYAIDTIGQVTDTIEDVDEKLWVMGRNFYNNGQGPRTELQLIRPDSYLL